MSARLKTAVAGFSTGGGGIFFQAGAADLPGSAAFTAAAMFSVGFRGGSVGTIFANRGAAQGWRIFTSGQDVSADIFETTGGAEVASLVSVGGLLSGDEFCLVHLVHDATTLELYVNGVNVASEAVDGDIIPSVLAPTIGVDRSGGGDAIASPALQAFILGAAYTEAELSATAVWSHYLACKLAGRMVDGAAQAGYGAVPAAPTFDHLWDAWFNNANRQAAQAGAVTWVDRKTPAVNFTPQGTPAVLAIR